MNKIEVIKDSKKKVIVKPFSFSKKVIELNKNLGNQSFKEKSYSEAIFFYQKGINEIFEEVESQSLQLQYKMKIFHSELIKLTSNIGLCHFKLKDYHKTIKVENTLLEMDPNNKKGFYIKFQCLLEQEEIANAKQLIEDAKKQLGKSKDSRKLINTMKLMLKEKQNKMKINKYRKNTYELTIIDQFAPRISPIRYGLYQEDAMLDLFKFDKLELFVYKDRLYCYGGRLNNSHFENLFYVLSDNDKTWKPIEIKCKDNKDIQFSHMNKMQSILKDDKLFLFGGERLNIRREHQPIISYGTREYLRRRIETEPQLEQETEEEEESSSEESESTRVKKKKEKVKVKVKMKKKVVKKKVVKRMMMDTVITMIFLKKKQA